MNRAELSLKLKNLNVDERAYTLYGGLPSEKYVLDQEADNRWTTYYSERGLRTGIQYHPNEESACDRLLQEISDDPTTRKR